MSQFIFEGYGYDAMTGDAFFSYGFDGDSRHFTERIRFRTAKAPYDEDVLDRALFLCFLLIGVSYYKTQPSPAVAFPGADIDEWQAGFLNQVYQEGLSQFAFENQLGRDDLAHFQSGQTRDEVAPTYSGSGTLLLQSGGKDSLLTALLLEEQGLEYDSVYVSGSDVHPALIDELSGQTYVVRRSLDHDGLRAMAAAGGLNGHVPVTYIVQAVGLVQAVLLGKQQVLASIGHEGQEAHAWIDDLPVNHQWSKTWEAEQLFAEYVRRYVSPDIKVGSLLRGMSELRIAELFAKKGWQRFGQRFSSCNRANYSQGKDNRTLSWCGECPKCANSYLLFAPFVAAETLKGLFGGRDLFASEPLADTFRGLLGVDDIMKPFECVGETAELRRAYHMAQDTGGYRPLPFAVPASDYDYRQTYSSQSWARLLAGDL